ncbi:MAG: type II toxin-antitoxin system RelE/ParE family toxin [Alphaproteobacteria bacterium]|nr:type II toxin-antitoxin system RelE/ParE family toxin [Alphaproteobacteria bacterium]
MIKSFGDKTTLAIARGLVVRGHAFDLQKGARRKLAMIEAAAVLEDLRVPPGNRLEALTGDRKGQFSIRVNRQWRICFRWRNDDAYDVVLVDYHAG